MFDELADGGRDVAPPGYPGKLVELPNGGRVGLRPVSSSSDKSPSWDVKISNMPVKKTILNHEKSMNITKQFLDEIIEEAKADEVGLWFIIDRVRDELGITQSEVIKAVTLHCVNQILASGAVVAGYYKHDGSGVDVWNMEPELVVSRIEVAWKELGREPNIGEIVVFIGKSN